MTTITMGMMVMATRRSRSPMIQGRILRKWCNLFGVQDEVQQYRCVHEVQDEVQEYSWWFHETCGSVF